MREEVDRLDADPVEVVFTAHSLPDPHPGHGRPVPRPAGRDGGGGGRQGRRRPVVGGLAERRPHARAVDRPRHPRRPAGAGRGGRRRRGGVRRPGSCPTTSRCCSTSTSRPAPRPAGLGLAFTRTPSPNADPAFCAAVADGRSGVMPDRRRVAVVGGGITGLAAARFLQPGRLRRSPWSRRATRPGGKIQTRELAGVPVEAGPDTFLARVPWAVDLCRELGLGDELVAPATGKAWLWIGDRLRPLPERHVLGVPTALRPLLRSGVLTPAGVARAALDLVLPRSLARRRPHGGRRRRPAHGPRGRRPPGRPARRRHQRRPGRRPQPVRHRAGRSPPAPPARAASSSASAGAPPGPGRAGVPGPGRRPAPPRRPPGRGRRRPAARDTRSVDITAR